MKFKSILLIVLVVFNLVDLQASTQPDRRRQACKAFLFGAAVVAASISTGVIFKPGVLVETNQLFYNSESSFDIKCPQIGVSSSGEPVYWIERYPGENCAQLISYTNEWYTQVAQSKQTVRKPTTLLRGKAIKKPLCFTEDEDCWLKKDTCLSGRPLEMKIGIACEYDACPKKGQPIKNWRAESGLFFHGHGAGYLYTWYGPDGSIKKVN